MEGRFAAAIAQAVAETPMFTGQELTPGRLLLADGDGLCYYCAGNEDTAPGEARSNMVSKLQSAKDACGAEFVKVLVTARGSNKGFRYAVARVKPYQGQRDNDRRPKNWQFLRELLETPGGLPDWIEVEFTSVAEADDLFSRYAKGHPDCVIYTQDKDMQMVPGWHLVWETHLLFKLEPGTWCKEYNDKTYGRKWFWMQMLHGDDADHIPGLPFYTDGSILKSGPNKGQIKEIRCGKKSEAVLEMLPKVSSDMGACILLQGLYKTCYGERWLVEMLEQGILLWMRDDETSSALNVVAPGNPLHPLTTHELWPAARAEVMARIAESLVYAQTEGVGSSDNASIPAGITAVQVPSVPATLYDGTGSAGSLSHDGVDTCGIASVVQCPAGQGGEQLPQVRGVKPSRIPAWCARLSATA